jgi:hypothetical protein
MKGLQETAAGLRNKRRPDPVLTSERAMWVRVFGCADGGLQGVLPGSVTR